MARDFRFGLGLQAARRQQSVQDWGRRAEGMGYDVVHLPDHLYTTAPFPMLTAVAMATETLRVGTFVLNAGFYKPALLARDVCSLRDLSGGRFELGLGAGYVKEEFEEAELPFPTAGQRVDHLRHVTEHMGAHVPDVPLLIAGNGDRLLTIAAQRAHIIGLTGGGPATEDADPLADRIAFVRDAAPDRFDDLELNLSIIAMPRDDSGVPDVSIARRFLPGLTDDELLRAPTVLSGSISDMADALRRYRAVYGITYITVQQPHAETFAKVIAELR
jgi:probable F420-dependent oxidoreductase